MILTVFVLSKKKKRLSDSIDKLSFDSSKIDQNNSIFSVTYVNLHSLNWKLKKLSLHFLVFVIVFEIVTAVSKSMNCIQNFSQFIHKPV